MFSPYSNITVGGCQRGRGEFGFQCPLEFFENLRQWPKAISYILKAFGVRGTIWALSKPFLSRYINSHLKRLYLKHSKGWGMEKLSIWYYSTWQMTGNHYTAKLQGQYLTYSSIIWQGWILNVPVAWYLNVPTISRECWAITWTLTWCKEKIIHTGNCSWRRVTHAVVFARKYKMWQCNKRLGY